ncbi:MAG: ComF family protein [Eggerthellaceae bacterium]|nr:ComF family protein [Eggerthellaceae bacterium]
MNRILDTAREAVLETLWPLRCACCDRPGSLLCDDCRLELSYIEPRLACPVCGSPHGRVQCCDCSATMLEPLGYERPPYTACVSTVDLDADSGRMVTLYKDAGDRGLARAMAGRMRAATPPSWLEARPAITFVPASEKALRRRGWDHAETLARAFAEGSELEVMPLFRRPQALDQRELSRKGRFRNMERAVRLLPSARVPAALILVDDVYTTGSTLFAAANALREGGAERIWCVTFARA